MGVDGGKYYEVKQIGWLVCRWTTYVDILWEERYLESISLHNLPKEIADLNLGDRFEVIIVRDESTNQIIGVKSLNKLDKLDRLHRVKVATNTRPGNPVEYVSWDEID